MNVNNLAAEVRLVPRDREQSERSAGRLSGEFEFHPQRETAYGVVRRFLLGPTTGLPWTPPPWACWSPYGRRLARLRGAFQSDIPRCRSVP